MITVIIIDRHTIFFVVNNNNVYFCPLADGISIAYCRLTESSQELVAARQSPELYAYRHLDGNQ